MLTGCKLQVEGDLKAHINAEPGDHIVALTEKVFLMEKKVCYCSLPNAFPFFLCPILFCCFLSGMTTVGQLRLRSTP